VQDIFDISSSLYLVANPVVLYSRVQGLKKRWILTHSKEGPWKVVFFTLVCLAGGGLQRPIVALYYLGMCRSIPVALHNWINITQQFIAHN